MMQTPIDKTFTVKCPKCGVSSEVESSRYFDVSCVCGFRVRHKLEREQAIHVLSLMGVCFSMDWDGQLIVDHEERLPSDLMRWIHFHQDSLIEQLTANGMRSLRVFIGGSMAGKRHGYYWNAWSSKIHIHLSKANWETYAFRDRTDPRLYFAGKSTSKAKAKAMVFVTSESNGNRR